MPEIKIERDSDRQIAIETEKDRDIKIDLLLLLVL